MSQLPRDSESPAVKVHFLASWMGRQFAGNLLVLDLLQETVIAGNGDFDLRGLPLSNVLTPEALEAIRGDVVAEITGWPLLKESDEHKSTAWRFECLIPNELGVLFRRAPEEDAEANAARIVKDELTGLSARGSLSMLLAAARERFQRSKQHFAVLFLDIDDFKVINDEQGHLAGDEVLRTVAAGIQRAIRPGDGAVRYGGDEFVVVIANVHSAEEAKRIALRLSDVATRPVKWKSSVLRFTASIGVAFSTAADVTASAILERADKAMYRAKNQGRCGRIEVD
jgi:diguanylate cyclase (GGDEF)-like protein